jgi:hypothetical protein
MASPPSGSGTVPIATQSRRCLLAALELLQEHDVGRDFGARVRHEGGVGQPHGAQELGALGDPRARGLRLLVHERVGHHHREHAARPQALDRLREEEVVDGPLREVRVLLVVHRLVAERRVADGEVERLRRDADLVEAR